MKDIHWLSAAEIGAAYRKQQLSPVEVVRALLDRIAVHDKKLNAFIRVDAEFALESARLAEKEIAAGRGLGPLHGVPVGIKDIIDVAGMPTTCHSKIRLDHMAGADAEVVARLRAGGAIILGKMALHEFAIGGPAFDLPFPPARNPWNVNCHPGGSSSGSGAAVAGGLLPLALGTDTGGSIRNPAASCGIVGLKPTYGAVSRRGVFPLAFTLDHLGPMARSVQDAALLMDAIAGHDAQDPGSVPAPRSEYGRMLHRGVRGLRVGFVRHFHETDLTADPDMAAGLEEAVRVLKGEGAEICDVRLPKLQEIAGVQRVIFQAESWAIHDNWLRERPGDYCQATRIRLLAGAFLSAGDLLHAQQRRSAMIRAVGDSFDEVDVLLVANAMDPACRIDDPAENARTYPRQARSPFNLTGHPALAVMTGLSKSGMPLSMQLVGRMHDEATLFRVAAAFERAAQWYMRRPPTFA